MTQSLFRSKLGLGVLIVTFTSGCVGHTRGEISAEPQISNLNSATGAKTKPEETAPSIVVHVDPKTGQIITPPAGALAGQILQPQGDTAKPPVAQPQQTISPVPGGGVMIHLDERFMTPSTATIDADGKVRVEHQSSVSDSNEKK